MSEYDYPSNIYDIVTDLHNNKINSAINTIIFTVRSDRDIIMQYRKILVDALNVRKRDVLIFIHDLIQNSEIRSVTSTINALTALNINWPELNNFKNSINMNNDLYETKLTYKDPVEKWVAEFKKSTHSKFKGKTPNQREKMARAAQYKAVQNKKKVLESKLNLIIGKIAEKYHCSLPMVKQELVKGVMIESKTTNTKAACKLTVKNITENLWYYRKYK